MKTPSSHSHPAPPNRGRPREFDMDEAIDSVIPVFCERGFHGTSINDLAESMQLTVGSIYKAFKDKRGLFLAALDREASLRDARLRKAVSMAKSGRDKLHAALLFYVGLSHGAEGIQGCLTIGTAVNLTSFDAEIAQQVDAVFRRREAYLAELLQQGQADRSVAAGIDCESTARLMLCLLQGLRVVGKTGRTSKELRAVAQAAMKILD
jgi:TetR/AcrR family transcriptional regulator, transcriptional repressor for nem operon